MKRILSIIAAAALCVSLAACGEINKAEKNVNDIFSAVKSADIKKMQNMLTSRITTTRIWN